jgi:uncharacterized protein YndB with AHSA1/START domain
MTTFATSRAFAVPPEQVFAAFAAPARLARWWGPDGFRNTFDVFEFKPGGHWRFTMHGPDGKDYPNEAVFVAIEPARSIVIKHTCQPLFQLSIGFERTPTGTLVTWKQEFASAEVAAAVAHIVAPANEQNLNRWQAEVAAPSR